MATDLFRDALALVDFAEGRQRKKVYDRRQEQQFRVRMNELMERKASLEASAPILTDLSVYQRHVSESNFPEAINAITTIQSQFSPQPLEGETEQDTQNRFRRTALLNQYNTEIVKTVDANIAAWNKMPFILRNKENMELVKDEDGRPVISMNWMEAWREAHSNSALGRKIIESMMHGRSDKDKAKIAKIFGKEVGFDDETGTYEVLSPDEAAIRLNEERIKQTGLYHTKMRLDGLVAKLGSLEKEHKDATAKTAIVQQQLEKQGVDISGIVERDMVLTTGNVMKWFNKLLGGDEEPENTLPNFNKYANAMMAERFQNIEAFNPDKAAEINDKIGMGPWYKFRKLRLWASEKFKEKKDDFLLPGTSTPASVFVLTELYGNDAPFVNLSRKEDREKFKEFENAIKSAPDRFAVLNILAEFDDWLDTIIPPVKSPEEIKYTERAKQINLLLNEIERTKDALNTTLGAGRITPQGAQVAVRPSSLMRPEATGQERVRYLWREYNKAREGANQSQVTEEEFNSLYLGVGEEADAFRKALHKGLGF